MSMQFDQRTHDMIRPRRSTDDEAKSSSLFRANVPFSWERKPGMSKLKPYSSDHRSLDNYFTTTNKLIPPPARLSSQNSATSSPSGHHRQSRRGPYICSSIDVQPSVATTFRNSFRLTGDVSPATAKSNPLQDDPFLAAFIKCTQMHGSGITNSAVDNKHDKAARFSARKKKNTMFLMFTSSFSRKSSAAVRDNNIAVTMPCNKRT